MNAFNEQASFHLHPSDVGLITQRPRVQCPDHGIIDGKIPRPTQMITTQEDTWTSWTPHGNALGLYEMHGTRSFEDQYLFPFATYMPNHCQWQDCGDLSGHQLLPSDAATHSLPCYTSARPVEETAITDLVQRSYPISTPITRSPSKRTQLSSTASHLRYASYPPSSDLSRRGALSDSLYQYQCQWSHSGSPCCALVESTKGTIAKHLQDAHAIPIKGDKTMDVCQWDGCGKAMRRGSIPRHVLAVHAKHKVHCPSCRSHFARPDSLQRHQRTCLGKIEDALDACKVRG